MKIRDLIILPAVENLRDWWLKRKAEIERKKILGANKDKVRIRLHTEIENEKEMEEYIKRGHYKDSNGVKQKIVKLGRSMESYYKE